MARPPRDDARRHDLPRDLDLAVGPVEPVVALSRVSTGAASARALAPPAGLDADAVADLARRAVAEDLDGGVDVTSVATVPGRLLGVAAFVPRQAGVVGGLGAAMAVLDEVLGAPEWLHVGADGDAAVPGTPCSRCAARCGRC